MWLKSEKPKQIVTSMGTGLALYFSSTLNLPRAETVGSTVSYATANFDCKYKKSFRRPLLLSILEVLSLRFPASSTGRVFLLRVLIGSRVLL